MAALPPHLSPPCLSSMSARSMAPLTSTNCRSSTSSGGAGRLPYSSRATATRCWMMSYTWRARRGAARQTRQHPFVAPNPSQVRQSFYVGPRVKRPGPGEVLRYPLKP